MTRSQINDASGFDNGEQFGSPEEVRNYFTIDNLVNLFNEPCPFSQEQLNEMAEIVILNEWNCVFLSNTIHP